jgi:hypothetical protein
MALTVDIHDAPEGGVRSLKAEGNTSQNPSGRTRRTTPLAREARRQQNLLTVIPSLVRIA